MVNKLYPGLFVMLSVIAILNIAFASTTSFGGVVNTTLPNVQNSNVTPNINAPVLVYSCNNVTFSAGKNVTCAGFTIKFDNAVSNSGVSNSGGYFSIITIKTSCLL